MPYLILLASMLLSSSLMAQLSIFAQSNRKQYLSYEPVVLTVHLQNRAGRDLVLKNTPQNPWIEFVVKHQNGRVVPPRQTPSFTGVKVPTGETAKSTFNLNNFYSIAEPGNYRAYAIVRTPQQSGSQGFRSAPVFFTVTNAQPMWRSRVGVPGAAGDEREYRLIGFSPGGGTAPQLYLQIEDIKKGHILLSSSLGPVLDFRKPSKTIDRSNNLHVLFLAAPNFHCHTVVTPNGKTIRRRYYRSIGRNNPSLLTHRDGSISVIDGAEWDPAAEAAEKNKFHNLSELPTH